MKPKLGKAPAVHDPRTLSFVRYRDTDTGIAVPATIGYEADMPEDWGMLGNGPSADMPADFEGVCDCVWADAAHRTMLYHAAWGRPMPTFTSEAVLSDYSAVTGYTPGDPATDNGTDMLSALNYQRKTGIVDAHGHRHRIGAYVSLEPGNVEHLREAVYLFGAVALGIKYPDTASAQFKAKQLWRPVPGYKLDGGHCITLVAHRAHLRTVTWAKEIDVTVKFAETFCDEAYGILSRDFLTDGKTPAGFDVATLNKDLAALER
jgi:hypothetical protein